MPESLDIFVQEAAAGESFREDGKTVFRYRKNLDVNSFVSLTMSVRSRDYVHDGGSATFFL